AGQTYTITPAPGFKVADVLVDSVSVGKVTSFSFSNVTANHTISASFAPIVYAITAIAGANGSIDPAGVTSVNSGASQGCTITPAAGYKVADVQIDNISIGAVPNYTFNNVMANHSITAAFTPLVVNVDYFVITATTG